jgi:adenine deaminase
VAKDGEFVAKMSPLPYPAEARNTVHLAHPVREEDLRLEVGGQDRQGVARVIRVLGDSLITEELRETVIVSGGVIAADPGRDLLKIVALERHNRSGEIGKGLVRGFGLKVGALASTYNPQQQNLQVVGADDADMTVAANELARIGGGMVAVRDGKVLACLALPLYGLLADKPAGEVAAEYGRLLGAVRDLGCPLPAPFHTLAFAGLPITIGRLKISPRGLVDVWQEKVVGLLAD